MGFSLHFSSHEARGFPEGSPSGNPVVCPQSGVYCQERVWFSRPWEVKSNLPQTASRAREHHTDAVLL